MFLILKKRLFPKTLVIFFLWDKVLSLHFPSLTRDYSFLTILTAVPVIDIFSLKTVTMSHAYGLYIEIYRKDSLNITFKHNDNLDFFK